MSNKKSLDLSQMKSSMNPGTRLKKFPPPPLHLPADEEKLVVFNEQSEDKKSTISCSLSSSAKECSHQQIPYTLPVGQRSQILQTLIDSSSTLLIQPSTESKQKRSHISLNTTQFNLLKRQHASRQGTVNDAEWIDFIRFIVYKPLENELKILLDKYKMTYFDRVNSPSTSDTIIRATLCDMVSQALTTYANNSSSIPSNDTSMTVSSSSNINLKRKRYDENLNNQTKFVISYLIPGHYDQIKNSHHMTYQQRQKFFQNKYNHLFKYIPDKDEQEFLLREGYLNNLSTDQICLMFYDEVIAYMDEDDLQLSRICVDNSFTLTNSILTHIQSSIR